MKKASLLAVGTILQACYLPVAMGEPYLCVGEHGAWVEDKDGIVTGSQAFRNDERWIVDERGLRAFGSEMVRLDECVMNEGRPTSCQQSGRLWGGHFSLGRDDVFTLMLLGASGDGAKRAFILKGKCSVMETPAGV
jgi:hypothetical protein